MKKIYTSLLVALLPILAMAQADVVLKLNDSANANQMGVQFKGSYGNWEVSPGFDDGTNGDETANDNIWTITITGVAAGTYEWGAENGDGTWLLVGDNPTFTVDANNMVTGQTEYVIPATQPKVNVTLTVNDQNADIASLDVKGAYGGWASSPAFDDGTNGDATAGDNVWTIVVEAEQDGSYEWGAERTDCDNPAWVLQRSNLVFAVDAQGVVSGETHYDIPSAGMKYNVTFLLDMSNEIPSGEGVHVSGNFLACAWDKDDYQMSPVGNEGVYGITIPVAAGSYEYKYFNGASGDDVAEAQAGTPDAMAFVDGGCGVDNGIGASNRSLDLSTMTGDTTLPIYVWNSCDISSLTVSTNERPTLAAFSAIPNPFTSSTLIDFADAQGTEFDLTITNITGQVVRQVNGITGTNYTIERGDLVTGIYLATLKNEAGEFYTHKLVVR